MSLRGVRQLKEFIVRYSDVDGSSRGVRDWMRTHLVDLAHNNPDTVIRTELKRAFHPILIGVYVNGNSKTICVKNTDPAKINSFALHLRNQIGRRMNSTGYKRPVLSAKNSLQGEWHEHMDLIDLPVTLEQFP